MRGYVWYYETLGNYLAGYLWDATLCQQLHPDTVITEYELLPPRLITIGDYEVNSEFFGFVDTPTLKVRLGVFRPEFPEDLRDAFLKGRELGIMVFSLFGPAPNPADPLRGGAYPWFVGIAEKADDVVEEEGQDVDFRFVDIAHYAASSPILKDDPGAIDSTLRDQYNGQLYEGRPAGHWGDFRLRQRPHHVVNWDLRGGLINLEALGDFFAYRIAVEIERSVPSSFLFLYRATYNHWADTANYWGNIRAGIAGTYPGSVSNPWDPNTLTLVDPSQLYVPTIWEARRGSEKTGVCMILARESIRDFMRQAGENFLQLYNVFPSFGLAFRTELNGKVIIETGFELILGAARSAWVDLGGPLTLYLSPGAATAVRRRLYYHDYPRRVAITGLPWGDEQSNEWGRRGLDWGTNYFLGTVWAPPPKDLGGPHIAHEPYATGSGLPLIYAPPRGNQLDADHLQHPTYLRTAALDAGTLVFTDEVYTPSYDGIQRDYRITQPWTPWNLDMTLTQWIRELSIRVGSLALLIRGLYKALHPEDRLVYRAELEVSDPAAGLKDLDSRYIGQTLAIVPSPREFKGRILGIKRIGGSGSRVVLTVLTGIDPAYDAI